MVRTKEDKMGQILPFSSEPELVTDTSSTIKYRLKVVEDGKSNFYEAEITNMNVFGNCSKAESVSLTKDDVHNEKDIWPITTGDWNPFVVLIGKPVLQHDGGGYKRQLEEIAAKKGITLPGPEISKLYSSVDAKVMEIYNKTKRV